MATAGKRLHNIGQQISQAADSPILYDSAKQLLTITLNRPKSLNAVNLEMIRNFTAHFSDMENHQVVWLQGAGKAFCAGGDIKAYFAEESTEEHRVNLCK